MALQAWRAASVLAILSGFAAMCGAGDSVPATKPIPVILDTDIGDDIDDTWALVMLLKSPQFDVKLITTTDGNPEYRAKIITKLLAAAKRTDIPIGLGVGPRTSNFMEAKWVEDVDLAKYPGTILKNGVDAAIDVIEKSSEPITVIAIGPLDTMAALAAKRPDTVAKAHFVGMQGSVYKGYDGGPVSAEWNVVANAPAAQKVFSTAWRSMTITPLDTCGTVILSGERFKALKASSDPGVRAILESYCVFAKKNSVDELTQSTVLFDTVAVYLANPGPKPLIEMKTLPIVVTKDGFTRVDEKGQKVSVAVAWKNLDAYDDLLLKVLLGK